MQQTSKSIGDGPRQSHTANIKDTSAMTRSSHGGASRLTSEVNDTRCTVSAAVFKDTSAMTRSVFCLVATMQISSRSMNQVIGGRTQGHASASCGALDLILATLPERAWRLARPPRAELETCRWQTGGQRLSIRAHPVCP